MVGADGNKRRFLRMDGVSDYGTVLTCIEKPLR